MNFVAPNQTPYPSQLPNSPFFAPFLSVPNNEPLDIQSVGEQAALSDPLTGEIQPPQGPVNMLAEYRSKFPYVGIRPFPNWEKTYFLVGGKPKEINIPSGVVTLTFLSSAPYLMSTKGNAQLPTADDGDESMAVYRPDNIVWYVGNVRHLSIIAPDTGTLVSVIGHRFEEMPR